MFEIIIEEQESIKNINNKNEFICFYGKPFSGRTTYIINTYVKHLTNNDFVMVFDPCIKSKYLNIVDDIYIHKEIDKDTIDRFEKGLKYIKKNVTIIFDDYPIEKNMLDNLLGLFDKINENHNNVSLKIIIVCIEKYKNLQYQNYFSKIIRQN